MMGSLTIGLNAQGDKFTLPADLGDKKIAMLAQSKKGKTYGLGVILEELTKAQRPWIATDPAHQLWGLRVGPGGAPSGLPIVVIGGPQGDIPFDKDAGERMAEALLATPICAVIDMAFESRGAVRHFMTAFAGRLMRSKPDVPRVIVLEEAPVLIPQHAVGNANVCKAAVANLAVIGGNFGYGVIPATQRPATIDKDVLSQCEGLIVMGLTDTRDRKAVKDWISSKGVGDRVKECFDTLGSLKPGEAWYWNPADDVFERFTFRKRETLHPREAAKAGQRVPKIQLTSEIDGFVQGYKAEASRLTVTMCPLPPKLKTKKALGEMAKTLDANWKKVDQAVAHLPRQMHEQSEQIAQLQVDCEDLRAENKRLQENLATEARLRREASLRLDAVRKQLRPQFDSLCMLFEDLGTMADAPAGGGDPTAAPWPEWLAKAGKVGCKGMLEILIRKGRLSQVQLATLSGIKHGGSSWRAYASFIRRNHLATFHENDDVEIAKL